MNGAVVSGGGDTDPGNGTATGPIEVGPPAAGSDLTLAKTRTEAGILMPGQPVTFTVRVTNVGGSPTSGTVTVTETPPAGLTVTALSGSGWTCTVATRTCTRADALAPSASYPDITVTANIAVDAVGTLVNSAVVSGGGDSSTGNNTAYKSDHNQSTTSPDLACIVRDWLDECAARDRAFGPCVHVVCRVC